MTEGSRQLGRIADLARDDCDEIFAQIHLQAVATAVDRLCWGSMAYRCDICGFEWEVWMALGVEGPPHLRNQGLYVATPFMAGRCPAWPIASAEEMVSCGGGMRHVRFDGDRQFEPCVAPDDVPRFVLPRAQWGLSGGADLEVPTAALVRARRWHADRQA